MATMATMAPLAPITPLSAKAAGAPKRAWAVLKTQPQRELLAARTIATRGVEAYVPLLPNARSARAAPLFPGYLFAHITVATDDLLRIRSVPGIAYILPHGAPPALLPDSVVSALRLRAAAPLRPFERGERVVLLTEPFRSLQAVFDRRLNAAGRVRVLLDLVDRAVRLEVDETVLERIR